MATSLTSDSFHEFSCTPCTDDGENREAEVYCVNCKEYLCRKCLRSHNRVPEAREHQLLGKDEFQQVATPRTNSKLPDLPTERCLRHHGKLVDMFCGDHDVVGCNTCMSLKHRACRDIFYIPDIGESRVTEQSMKTIQGALSTLQQKTAVIKDKQLENQSRIVKEKDGCLDKIFQRRKEIDKQLDKIQNVQTTHVIDRFDEFNSKLGEDINLCDKTVTLINLGQETLSTSDSKQNTSQTFIHMKQAEKILSKAGKELKEIVKNMYDSPCLYYETNTSIDDVLSSRDLFGSLHAGFQPLTNLDFIEDINIKIDSDTDICSCDDLCQLPDGTIIVTDCNNRNIKSLKYDIAYKVNDSLTMSNSPRGVCCITDNDIAVTVPADHKVEIVSVKPEMSIKTSVKVDIPCQGIDYNEGRLYIEYHFDKMISVYDLEANCLQTYQTNKKDEALFSAPLHLCVMPDRQQIAVADRDKGIVVIDMSGELVTKHTYTNRQSTYGVCIDDKGNLILTDFTSKQIVAVGEDNTCRALLTNMDKHPKAVFFDKLSQKLFLTQFNCDFMKVFKPKYTFAFPS